ncbi:MAG: hypothetical protein ABH845_02085 [Candidatus Omnitrophota bacterium]
MELKRNIGRVRGNYCAVIIFFLLLAVGSIAQAKESSEIDALYNGIMRQAENAHYKRQSERVISDIYLKGAAASRDLGGWKHVIDLFEKALSADPTNARAFRVYGDYLMGYRGMYEQAAEQYRTAIELINARPDLYPEDEKHELERSMQILHRDGDNGKAVIATAPVSVFMKPVFEYSTPQELPLDLTALDHSAEQYGADIDALYLSRYGYIPSDSETIDIINDVTVTKAFQREQLARLRAGEMDLQQDILRGGGTLTLRFGPSCLPYLRSSYERKDIDPKSYPKDLSNRSHARYDHYTASLYKNLMIPGFVDLQMQAGVSRQEAVTLYEGGRLLSDETTDALNGEVTFIKDIGNDTLRLSAGGEMGKIDDETLSDDAKKTAWSVETRYSMYPSAEPESGNPRTKGQFSQHIELGYRETLRDYLSATDPITTEYHHIPRVGYEGYGMLNGKLDVAAKYEYEDERLDDQTSVFVHHIHEVFLYPAWVMAYKLYDHDFVSGLEHMRLGVPTTVYFGEGSYDAVTTGLQFEQLYVTEHGFSLRSTLGVHYTYYQELEEDDFGVYIQVNLEAGPSSFLTGAKETTRRLGEWEEKHLW